MNFNVERPINLQIMRDGQTLSVKVRFPSDDEWSARQRQRKIIVKSLGRGTSETSVPNGEDCDASLLACIRQDDGQPEVDPFEASKMIEQLALCDVDDALQVGNTFDISLRVPGAMVKHVVRMPSAKDVALYRRSFARVLDLPFNKQQLTLNLAPAAELYDRLVERVEGYEGVVPVIHKTVVVKAAVDLLDQAFQTNEDF